VNWEALGAIGEVVGAIAVLGTLVYIAIQIKRTQNVAIAQAADNSQQITLQQSNQWLEHIDVILKANSDEILSDKEHAIIQELMQTRRYMAFLLYTRMKSLNNSQHMIASNFAGFLLANPGAQKWWQENEGMRRKRGFALNPIRSEFSQDVEAYISKHKDRASGA